MKRNSIQRGATLARLAVACLLSSAMAMSASANPDDTLLPKLGSVEKVIVVDVSQDLNLPGVGLYTERHDATATLACFQGLINRQDGTTKVYLKGMPVRLFWNLYDGGHGSPDDILIEQMRREVDVEFAQLDRRKTLPALSWLLERYGHLVKGTVRLPRIDELGWKVDTAQSVQDPELFAQLELFFASRAAALNAAMFNDALPCTSLAELIIGKREAFYYKRVEIPTFTTAVEALEWSYENYFDDPRRTDRLLAVSNENCQNPPHMWDYWYGTYTYAIGYLTLKWDREAYDASATAQFVERNILPHYAAGTCVYGEIEGSHIIPHLQGFGFQIQQGPVPNLSVLSAFHPEPSWFKSAPEPRVFDVDPDGIYVAWNTIDGDANDIALMTIKGLASDPASGRVKVGVRYNPFFLDLNPLLIRWLTEFHPETIDLVPSPHDGGIPGTPESAEAYRRCYAYMHRVGNRQFQVYNFFGELPKGDQDQWTDLMHPLDPLLCIRGYQGGWSPESAWKIVDGVLHCNQIGRGRWGQEQLLEQYRQALLRKKPGESLFAVFKCPSEFGMRASTMIAQYQERLLADAEIQKCGAIHFVLPRDLAATVRKQMDQRGVTELRW